MVGNHFNGSDKPVWDKVRYIGRAPVCCPLHAGSLALTTVVAKLVARTDGQVSL